MFLRGSRPSALQRPQSPPPSGRSDIVCTQVGSTCGTLLTRMQPARSLTQHAVSQQARPALAQSDTESDVQVIAVGRRCSAGLRDLAQTLPCATVWQLDENGHEMAGNPKQTSAKKGGTPGLAFVITSADTNTEGLTAVKNIVQHLRSQNTMAAVAMTRPFAFEGARRAHVAEQLLNDLSTNADLVVVVEQEKLCGGTGDAMTVAEALTISDQALVTSVHAVAQAAAAPLLLRVIPGLEIWQGVNPQTDGNSKARFELLQHLFLPPGGARLGRGMAQMPVSQSAGVSVVSTIAHMTADSVSAASESPFLDGLLTSAAAVLCCVGLPQLTASPTEAEIQQARTVAVRSALSSLTALTAGRCPDMVICCYHRATSRSAMDAQLQVEVSLLAIPSPPAGSPKRTASRQQQQQQNGSFSADATQRVSQSWNGGTSALAGGVGAATGSNRAHSNIRAAPSAAERSQGVGSASKPEAEDQLGDFLLDSLTALSMDLPPKAAQWRKKQRMQLRPGPAQGNLLQMMTGSSDEDSEPATGGQGLFGSLFPPRREPSAKARTLNIVSADRGIDDRD